MPDRRSWPDLTGLLQASCDILEKARIIRDDQDIKKLEATIDPEPNKKNPRAVLLLEELS